ncbi:unnamed protein product [Clonostachys rhizophaga]|uniref:Xylanolytic transcriptional activator regulatory domain-containing protein n=1 Tax=Clonostachys rhizophaga TaxID=160324 RepID=A0A9N9YGW6_9HYPO|nr:unnamed protein product [Clonostachys rhizophaga]
MTRGHDITCLVQDSQTSRPRPRNYVELLEDRVASLEHISTTTTARTDSSVHHSGTSQSTSNATGSTPSTNYYTSPEQGGGHSSGDLPSRVGMLDFRTLQIEPQYLGSSSAFAFSRIISLPLNRNLPPSAATTGPALGDQPGLTGTPCPLPDYDTAISLSNAYFKYIHPQYPFLHEPTFRTWEAKVYGASPESIHTELFGQSLFFLNMVYAVAALLKNNTDAFAEQLYTSAQLHSDALANDSLESIQAILLCAMYSLRSLTGPSLWELSGLALRKCIGLGYHRSAKRHAPAANMLRHELRKRVFWVAQGLDCTMALRLGRPLGIPLQEIDAELPADVNDSCISEMGITAETGASGEPGQLGKSTITHANHVFRLRIIQARICTSLFSDTARLSVHDTAYQTRIQQLRADLDQWHAAASPSTKPLAVDDLTMFNSTEWYDMNYSYTILLLYRNQLEAYELSSDQIFSECIRASRTLCQGYRRLYIGTYRRYTWGTLSCLFLAGLVYLHCLWTVPSPWDVVALDDFSKTCTECTMVLVAISEGWRGAAPYRDTFEVLASRTMSMMINRDRSLPLQEFPPPSSSTNLRGEGGGGGGGGGDQVDWNNWLRDAIEAGTLDGLDGFFGGFIEDFGRIDDVAGSIM